MKDKPNKQEGKILKKVLIMVVGLVSLSYAHVESKKMLLYVITPISSLKILPTDTHISGAVSDKISFIASPGEYEPASFVVSALSDIASLKVEATDLKGKEGIIPCSNIDIKIVKCWYQAGSAWVGVGQDKSKRGLRQSHLKVKGSSNKTFTALLYLQYLLHGNAPS